MQLVIPGVGNEQGPDYALDVNSSLSIIDQHDHSIGKGLPITPSGLSINADLAMNNNNLTLTRTVRFNVQGSAPSNASDLGILYEMGVDLYYKDGAGNVVRITQGGAVTGASGTITGLPSGTASASFAAGTFVFQAATLTAANIDGASFILRNSTASSFGLTLSPPSAMAFDTNITLPVVPASQKYLAIDASGMMTALSSTTVAIYTLTGGTNSTNSDLAVGSVSLVAGNARPIKIYGVSAGMTSDIVVQGPGTAIVSGLLTLVRDDSTVIGVYGVQTGSTSIGVPVSSLVYLDPTPGSGTRTYTLYARTPTASTTVIVQGGSLIAEEL